MVWPWVVVYSTVNLRVWIASPFGAELPYCPVIFVFIVEKPDKGVGRVAVSSLGVCGGRTRSNND